MHFCSATRLNVNSAVLVLSLQAWLKAPLVDAAAIQQRLDIVEAMVTDQGLREAVRDALRGALAGTCESFR